MLYDSRFVVYILHEVEVRNSGSALFQSRSEVLKVIYGTLLVWPFDRNLTKIWFRLVAAL